MIPTILAWRDIEAELHRRLLELDARMDQTGMSQETWWGLRGEKRAFRSLLNLPQTLILLTPDTAPDSVAISPAKPAVLSSPEGED
jgi:hypothetical protein